MKKILIICPYPTGVAPSQRFRYEQYLSQLKESSLDVVISPFFSEREYLLYQSGNIFLKFYSIAISYLKRFLLLFGLSRYEMIFIHREVSPAGPPFAEYFISKVKGKKIVYDFDDAIWLTDRSKESALAELIRCRWKVGLICKWSYKISCGNNYLAQYGRQFNPNVFLNPTTIDTLNIHTPGVNHRSPEDTVTIGWTGSHSTLKYLWSIVPVLQILENKYPQTEFLIIADKNPNLPLKNAAFRPWAKETEIADLADMDIGVMPMPEDAWTKGKCGLKALQYMAMEIPAVVSPVAINMEIVQHGVDGYWCSSFDEWFTSLSELILDPVKRIEMGKRGRQKVLGHYSAASNSSNFLSLFQ